MFENSLVHYIMILFSKLYSSSKSEEIGAEECSFTMAAS